MTIFSRTPLDQVSSGNTIKTLTLQINMNEENKLNSTDAVDDRPASCCYPLWVLFRDDPPPQGKAVLISDGKNIGHARYNGYNKFHVCASNDPVNIEDVTWWSYEPHLPSG